MRRRDSLLLYFLVRGTDRASAADWGMGEGSGSVSARGYYRRHRPGWRTRLRRPAFRRPQHRPAPESLSRLSTPRAHSFVVLCRMRGRCVWSQSAPHPSMHPCPFRSLAPWRLRLGHTSHEHTSQHRVRTRPCYVGHSHHNAKAHMRNETCSFP